MSGIPILRLFGVTTTLHWTTVIFLCWVAYTQDHIYTSATLIVFASLILHEYGHAAVARLLRIPAAGITVYPFGGACYLGEPPTPAQDVAVSVAGPAVTTLLMILGGLLFYSYDNLYSALIFVGNAILLAVNLLPVYPTDGGRILRAGLSALVSKRVAEKVTYGVALAVSVLVAAAATYTENWTLGLLFSILGANALINLFTKNEGGTI